MMLDEATLFQRVQKVVAQTLAIEKSQIKPNSSFTEDLNADSLDLVELVMEVEEEFKPDMKARGLTDQISDEDAEGLLTPSDVVNYILAKAGVN